MTVFEHRMMDPMYLLQMSVNFCILQNKHLYHITANFYLRFYVQVTVHRDKFL